PAPGTQILHGGGPEGCEVMANDMTHALGSFGRRRSEPPVDERQRRRSVEAPDSGRRRRDDAGADAGCDREPAVAADCLDELGKRPRLGGGLQERVLGIPEPLFAVASLPRALQPFEACVAECPVVERMLPRAEEMERAPEEVPAH